MLTSNKQQTQANVNSNQNIWANFKRIDLVQFAKDKYGFSIDNTPNTGSYSRNDGNLEFIHKKFTHLEMYQPSHDGVRERKSNVVLLRKSKAGEYFYTNPDSPSDRGTIVDFVANRENYDPKNKADLAEIAKIIKEYDGTAIERELPAYIPSVTPIKDRNAEIARYHKLLSTFKHPEYLLARGITNETLKAPELSGRIMNTIFRDKKGNTHINTAFPIVDKHDNLCGIENKNVGFSGYEPSSERNIWRSNVLSNEDKIDKIIIGEANIDLISYAQLNKLFSNQEKVLLVGHGGNLTNDQIDIIQFLVEKHQPKQVILTEDRDPAGYRYDIKLMGALNRPSSLGEVNPENDFKAEINIRDRSIASLSLNFSFSNLNEGKDKVDSIIQTFNKLNIDPEQPIFKFNEKDVSYGNNSASFKIEFHLSELNLKKVLEIVKTNRKIDDFIKIDKPQGATQEGNKIADWNELLMKEMRIAKNDIPQLMHKMKNSSSETVDIIAGNSFKPEKLLENFIKSWEIGLSEAQKGAVEAGVNTDVISFLVAKNQLVAFNNYLGSVQKAYDLDFVEFKEFVMFKDFVAQTRDKFMNVINDRKSEASKIEEELSLLRGKMQIEGDSLSLEDYNKLVTQKHDLDQHLKEVKKSYGGYNEFVDGKKFEELGEKLNAKARKIWDKPVREFKDGVSQKNSSDTEIVKEKNNGLKI